MRMRLWLGGMMLAVAAVILLRAADSTDAQPAAMPAAVPPILHEVVIRRPAGPPRVQSGVTDHAGQPATVACSTCHTARTPNPANRGTADLDLFHQGLQVVHGNAPATTSAAGITTPAGTNTCLTCHNPGDYDSLRLANGEKVAFTDVVRLCSQCHGPQYRDYQHGAHGGMNGYWDLTRGGRMRQGCTGCHDPHVPKYQGMQPMPPPQDRFFNVQHAAGAGHE